MRDRSPACANPDIDIDEQGEPGAGVGPRSEAGMVSLWVLYWSISILFIAGFGLDLWRGVAVRRALVEQAEAAAAAGANGVDTDAFRTTGAITIDHTLAEALARENLAAQSEFDLVENPPVVMVDGTTQEVTVRLTAVVDFTLIKVFLSDEAPLEIAVEASAAPRIGGP
ncbi:MAG: hypothetical protein GY724_06290 [Actinomycetia bacterium]|nr:hypothetical protein [Actinomycetes bacterium]MCP5034025.1 hypothetical protein [Actinomycetes bacterium]